MNEKSNWKIGDWCFAEYKLKQVKKVTEGRVTELSDGYFSSSYSNYNDEIFELTLNRKIITEFIQKEYEKLREFNGLNFPDLNRKYIAFFIEGCSLPQNLTDKTEKLYNDFHKKVSDFTKLVLGKVQDVNVDGVSLFRR